PKDIRAFTAAARQLGADDAATLLRAAEIINEHRPTAALDLITRALDGPLAGRPITVWGAAFKPGTNDVRESPALAVARLLQDHGARITVHDPHAVPTALARHPELEYTDDLPASLKGADAVVLATEWPHYRDADPTTLHDLPAQPLIID
ncbi:UDP-glucose 6-dehydrogenase, partial [Streptomyces varsoviensis]